LRFREAKGDAMRPNESETWTVGLLLFTMFLTAGVLETHRYYGVLHHGRLGRTLGAARPIENTVGQVRSSATAAVRRSPVRGRADRPAPARSAQRPALGHRDRDRAKALMLLALIMHGARPGIGSSR